VGWQSGDLRILAIGDSNTYGVWLVDRERESYPAQLEAVWNEDDDRARADVLNLGYPGTNSSRLVQLLPEFLDTFAPDVVLAMVGVNDFWTQPVAVEQGEAERGLCSFVKRHSRLYKGLYILLRRSGATALDVSDAPDSSFERGEGTIRAGGREFEVGWTTEIGDPAEVEAGLRDDLRRLVALAADGPTRLVLMTYPGRFRYYGVANDVIRAVAEETGTPLVDLAAVFAPRCPERSCPDWLFEDQHPKPRGYRLVAETIAKALPAWLER
jgi:lysophospholipase L1-like esterase